MNKQEERNQITESLPTGFTNQEVKEDLPPKKTFRFTSESVTEGHPDKICDQISDAILDAYLTKDPNSRCAVECLVTKDQLIIAGEVSSRVRIKHARIARKVIEDIGYIYPNLGFSYKCKIKDLIHNQSAELSRNKGAGDQGLMFGYACNQTPELMPMPIVLAHKLTKRLSEVRKKNIIGGLYPDGKSQVTVEYEDNKPVGIGTIFISTHHDERYAGKGIEKLRLLIKNSVIDAVIPNEMMNASTKIMINPNGPWFDCGGPAADTGLTGRKIIADTYGGWARHGGGAFSGKDATKMDRTGAYFARCLAKVIVDMGYADECEIQLGFSIGGDKIISRRINTFGTMKTDKRYFGQAVNKQYLQKFLFYNSNITISKMIDKMHLRKPIFRELCNYGHFGKKGYKWEI